MVRATFAGFSTALSAMQANQKRLDITGQNLSNMKTVGYTRQQLQTSSLNYTNPIAHYTNGTEVAVGFGVHMDKVTQIRDPYLDIQYRNQMSKSSYTDAMQTSLDSLSKFLDESSISGIRKSFDDIQTVLTSMQDPSKVNDPIYESELRSQMLTLTNKLNDAARKIDTAEKNEFDRLDGSGTSEQGAVQEVNELLRQIGEMNDIIKRNQVLGQQSLELIDDRNVLIDELASYIPIEVTYYKDDDHSGYIKKADGTPELDANRNPMMKIYDYDSNGNILGKKEWPDDLRIEMVYTDSADKQQKKITLVDGTKKGEDGKSLNYGSLEITKGERDEPEGTQITFKAAPSTATPSSTPPTPSAEVIIGTGTDTGVNQFSSGSIQASLDMLGKTGTGDPLNDVNGYQYYMDELDKLAEAFATVMNGLNNKEEISDGNGGKKAAGDLLVNRTNDSTTGITAANIGIAKKWVSGETHISTGGKSPSDTVLNMKQAMSEIYPTDAFDDYFDGAHKDAANNTVKKVDLGGNTFADYMNHVSTLLANDSSRNTMDLKNNVTVLNSIEDSRDSVSGVSLDEEAANMMTALSAYNAAARLMTTLDEALNTLINGTGLVGR